MELLCTGSSGMALDDAAWPLSEPLYLEGAGFLSCQAVHQEGSQAMLLQM